MPKQSSTRSAHTRHRAARKEGQDKGLGQPTGGARLKPKRLHYTDVARQQVLAAWPDILQGLIKKATSGGYQHTKLLLDLCESANLARSQPDPRYEQQLCDVLLEGLRLSAFPPESATMATAARRKSTEERDDD